jgi:phosphoribosylformylglycinamidine synthase|tara:strand:+ start:2786 stop:3376 length:591 start_codon:yes stop_codon:yes gene_type:complete
MRSVIVEFPGSNCVAETQRFLDDPTMVWHTEIELPDADLYVLPGGFSYGDYMRGGALAGLSPVINSLKQKAQQGKKILGICNGFQILCEIGLLPGTLRKNQSGLFVCETQTVYDSYNDYVLPIAHGEGNYYHPNPSEVNVALRYKFSNPNGSVNNIAGIYNDTKNVMGLMPHPERAFESFHITQDGFKLLDNFMER